MPELPEVETIVRYLRPRLGGRRIRSVEVLTPAVCAVRPASLEGAWVRELARRGKYALMFLQRGARRPVLEFHLGMTGRLLLQDPPAERHKHDHLVMRFLGAAQELCFRDPRKFGEACLYGSLREVERTVLSKLGPEAHTLTAAELARVAWTGSRPLKPLLMDQRKVAGLGNIYTDEALWQARIHPLRLSDSLSADELSELARAIRTVLGQAIRDRGSSVNDYLTPDGSPGGYQLRHAVYNRAGRPCPRCGEPVVRIVVQGRGTHLCPLCQPSPACGDGHAD